VLQIEFCAVLCIELQFEKSSFTCKKKRHNFVAKGLCLPNPFIPLSLLLHQKARGTEKIGKCDAQLVRDDAVRSVMRDDAVRSVMHCHGVW
jgi:hypothetical protein